VDIQACGFWRCSHHKTFFDVRVFNRFAATNCSSALATTFRRHEGEKRRAYEERIHEVEHGSFTSLALVAWVWLLLQCISTWHIFKCKAEFPLSFGDGLALLLLGVFLTPFVSEVLKRFTILLRESPLPLILPWQWGSLFGPDLYAHRLGFCFSFSCFSMQNCFHRFSIETWGGRECH